MAERIPKKTVRTVTPTSPPQTAQPERVLTERDLFVRVFNSFQELSLLGMTTGRTATMRAPTLRAPISVPASTIAVVGAGAATGGAAIAGIEAARRREQGEVEGFEAPTGATVPTQGFTAPQGAPETFEGIEQPQAVTLPDGLPAPQGADLPTGAIDAPDTSGQFTGAGLSERTRTIPALDPQAAIREANEIIKAAQQRRANIGARLGDLDAGEGGDTAGREARELSDELEEMAAVEERAIAIRAQLIADARAINVMSVSPQSQLNQTVPGTVADVDADFIPDQFPDTTTPDELPAVGTNIEVFEGDEELVETPGVGDPVRSAQATTEVVDTGIATPSEGAISQPVTTTPDIVDPVEAPIITTGEVSEPEDVAVEDTLDDLVDSIDAFDKENAIETAQTDNFNRTGSSGAFLPLPPDNELIDRRKNLHPVVLQWRENLEGKQVNLQTGQITTVAPERVHLKHGTPQETLETVVYSKDPPRLRKFDMGAVVATLNEDNNVSFEPDMGQTGVIRETRRVRLDI